MSSTLVEVATPHSDREFPESDIDAVCARSTLEMTIAEALGCMPDEEVMENGERVIFQDPDIEDWLQKAASILEILVERGLIRFADYVYDETPDERGQHRGTRHR